MVFKLWNISSLRWKSIRSNRRYLCAHTQLGRVFTFIILPHFLSLVKIRNYKRFSESPRGPRQQAQWKPYWKFKGGPWWCPATTWWAPWLCASLRARVEVGPGDGMPHPAVLPWVTRPSQGVHPILDTELGAPHGHGHSLRAPEDWLEIWHQLFVQYANENIKFALLT